MTGGRIKGTPTTLTRRSLLAAAGGAVAAWPGAFLAADAPAPRRIAGMAVPPVGLGTWITFNVGRDPVLLAASTEVVAAFFAAGGRAIDSSPMYGSSQATVGHALDELEEPGDLFSADKVWTPRGGDGRAQIAETRALWTVPRLSLVQVHNLVDWRAHLPMLQELKAEGRIGAVGITTSHGRRHREFARLMESQPLDVVQLTYNPVDRAAEDRLLPIARERGLPVIVNRPFRGGSLTRALEGRPLPGLAADLGAATWAQLILKFILSHEVATLPIPATTVPAHAAENVAAARGPMPDPAMRGRIAAAIEDA